MECSVDCTKINDTFYRYKRPLIITKHNKSNKTYLENIDDVCKAIFRDKTIFYIYLKVQLNTRVNTKKNWASGKILNSTMENHINDFVNTYVLCGSCSNPETELKKKKSKDYLYLKCKACGERTIVQNNKVSEKILKSNI